jgi:hypothetical protein
MIAHGDERGWRDDEGDAGHVGRVLGLADEERVQVVHAVLRIMRFGRLGKIRVGLGRHGRADELLNFPILLDRRIDQVDPDSARRDLQVGRFEQRALDSCRRGAVACSRRLHNGMDNDHEIGDGIRSVPAAL